MGVSFIRGLGFRVYEGYRGTVTGRHGGIFGSIA